MISPASRDFIIVIAISFQYTKNNNLMLHSTHKMANLNQNEICAVLCSKRQYKQHDGEKWLCEILHIAGLLNSENPIQIQTETFIKHVLPSKVRAINCLKNTNHRTKEEAGMGRRRADKKFFVCQRDQEHNIHYTTINKYDIT